MTSSQGSITFSYTHVDAPSPSSSYGRSSTIGKGPTGPGTGWTMVTSPLSSSSRASASMNVGNHDVDVENEVEVNEDGSVTELGGAGGDLRKNRRIREGKEAIKYDVEEIVNGTRYPPFSLHFLMDSMHGRIDPLHAVHSLSSTEYEERVASGIGHPELQHQHAMRAQKRQKFVDCLTAENVDMAELRKLAWSGMPEELRPISWMLLLVCRATFSRLLHMKGTPVRCLMSPLFPAGLLAPLGLHKDFRAFTQTRGICQPCSANICTWD